MRGRSWTQRCGQALAVVVAAMALSASAAWAAAEPHPHVGKLPGFPVIRGVMPVLGSKAAVGAHEKLVNEAFDQVRARGQSGSKGTPVPNEEYAECEAEFIFYSTQDMCYRGGPVVRGVTIHLIFWQGPVNGKGESETLHVGTFTEGYENTVEQYFEDVAHDSHSSSNVFAVDQQYGEESGGKYVGGEYALSFSKATDVKVSHTAFPANGAKCVDETKYSEGPCLLDTNIQEAAEAFGGSKAGLKAIYVVLTPPGVGGCFEEGSEECAYRQYCAYHGDFGGDGKTPGDQTLYADLPFIGEVPGCDSGVHPNSFADNGADAAIDTASHEINETITDPIGSQCAEEGGEITGCEENAWTDAIGQEVGDKCLPPEVTIDGIYGEPLGELLREKPASGYNQEIGEHVYWTQREWSNEAGITERYGLPFPEGGCVQRMIEASFTISANPHATAPVTLDGSGSGAPGDPAVYWVWNILNTGEQFGAESPTLSHAFAAPGEYLVGLTAYDRYGNAQATLESFTVGAAPPPPPPTPPTVIKEVIVPGHYTAAQVSAALGLPANGKRFSGNGPFALGHGECPPACGVVLQLYAKVKTGTGKHRSTKLVLIGSSAQKTFAVKHGGALALALNARGRALLRRHHTVSCGLLVTVEGQEGGIWQIVRALTVTGNGAAARHARR